jgi:hypothetical protein
MRGSFAVSAVLQLVLMSAALQGKAATSTFSDGDSSAVFDPAQGGLTAWFADNASANQLPLQNFWFNAGGNNTALDSLGTPAVSLSSDLSTLAATYSNAAFSVTLKYTMTDFGGGSADIAESIKVKNNTSSALNLTFFQYSDYDLNGTPGGDTAQLGQDSVSGKFVSATQSKGFGPLATTVEQTVVTPEANHGEVNGSGSLLGEIGTGAYVLNDNLSPVSGSDVSWALQWDLNLAAEGTAGISEDNLLSGVAVPEPSALAFVCLGMAALGLSLRGRPL